MINHGWDLLLSTIYDCLSFKILKMV
ncbi:hypothetical protein RAZWK3B_09671 [Roseobacter sp. AzwK-3b]|nr:hypothetical protein RAZWK3B_09671 [Roseobacter sp. AzwK-3b]